MKRTLINPLLALAVSGLVAGCHEATPKAGVQAQAQTAGVCVANYPLSFFAESLLAGALPVYFDAPADEDPAFWQPNDEALIRFQSAQVILLNGAGYSKWVDQVSLSKARVVETSAAFEKAFIEVKEAVTHSHGPEGEHAHTGVAFTTWIDLDQAAQQLDAVKGALLPSVPKAERARVEERAQSLRAKLLAWDARLKTVGEKLKGKALLGSHPVYQYFARRYHLNLREVHWEPETVPDAKALEELKGILQTHPAKVMLWEGAPAAESVALLKALGIESVVFDPCGNRPEAGDFFSVMETNVSAMEGLAP